MKKGAEKSIKKFLKLIELYKDTLVIVEGKNDKAALKELGFTKVAILDKALYKVVESITEQKVSILTDLDGEGRKLYFHLRSQLTQRGILVDNKLRDLLFKTDLKQIEGINSYIKKIKEQSLNSQTTS